MKHWVIVASAALMFAGSGLASEADYEQSRKALSAKDWAAAMGYLESALKADPDSMKYGSEYRQAVLQWAKATHPKEGQPQDFDRPLKFFEQLVAANPTASQAFLNYGFVFVDKIPAAGSITQVILANSALAHFTKSLEIKPSWIGYYTRGNSYLYWPRIFGRTQLGLDDLEKAMQIQKAGPKKSYHVRVYISLGDGYWKMDDIEKARAIWKEGLKEFPESAALKDRLAREGEELKTYIETVLDPSRRVDTDLRELWSQP